MAIVISVEEALGICENIPEENWRIGSFYTYENKRCFRAHLSIAITGKIEKTVVVNIPGEELPYNIMCQVNDGRHKHYKQDTPKKRVIKFLNDLKNNDYGKPNPVR